MCASGLVVWSLLSSPPSLGASLCSVPANPMVTPSLFTLLASCWLFGLWPLLLLGGCNGAPVVSHRLVLLFVCWMAGAVASWGSLWVRLYGLSLVFWAHSVGR